MTGKAWSICLGLQSGQLSSTAGSATGNQTLVIAYSAYEADKDRCEGKAQS